MAALRDIAVSVVLLAALLALLGVPAEAAEPRITIIEVPQTPGPVPAPPVEPEYMKRAVERLIRT